MSKIDYQALREKAEKATSGVWSLEYGEERFDADDALIHREVVGYLPICRIEGAHPESGFDEDFQMEQQANAEFIAAASPATVLALLDERERNQQYIKSRDQENEEIALTVGKLRVELEAVQKTSAARIEAIDRTHKMFQREKDRADAAEKCIAELSASHSKLRDTMAGIHNTIRMDGGYTPLAAILNAAKRAYEESASAAGIRIKGGE
ncbi:ead/Ea22-like family protein [Escherichia coli]|nr:ead/Ea22-like family protein [Escherichia coli]